MKKVKNILLLLTAIFTLGCSQTIIFEDVQTPTPTPTPKPEPEPDFDSSSYIDLSAEGTANCYLVKAAGKYKFKAVKGNSTQSVGAASSADVLWESFGTSTKPNEGDLIASATYKDGYVYFATPTTFKSGNASIAVRDSNAKILWSWHIWLSKEGWNDHIYANNAGTMMDRNLGATSATPGDVGAFGLLYQWGRKDPFLGSSSISSNTLAVSTGSWSSVSTQQTVDYVTANPMTFVDGRFYEWCSEIWNNYEIRWKDSKKTMYDPCPVGYCVPSGDNSGFWAMALGRSDYISDVSTWDSTNKGLKWELADGTTAWYPAVGCRSYFSGALNLVGETGFCRSATPTLSSTVHAYGLRFNSNGTVFPAGDCNRGDAQSVRCVSTTATSVPTPEPTEPANNEIWYTSTDGKVVTPAGTGYFNVSITSNTYSNGKGVITFSGPITTVGRDKGEEPFANCAHNLKSVVLPNGLKTIGYGAFSLCSGLESVTIPETVTYIKYGAFYDCNKLTAIALPSGLLRIDDNAFASCDLVESVTIPDSVTLIGRGAFSGEKLRAFYGKYASSDNKLIVVNNTVICAALGGLTEYSIPNVVKIIDFCAFSGYKNIKKFTIPNSVVSIGDGSFSYCTSLQDITIPDSVTEIVGGSFFNCTSLTSAILSKNLTKIGDATFMNCSKLKNIYCSAVTPPQCGKDLFEGVTTDFKIYVPASSVSAYKSASGWSTYADAIVADPNSFTSAPYAVGDYYNDGTKEGVVFEVWDNGNSGKIVSMTESTTVLQWSSDETEQKRLIGADSETDGAYNTAKVKAISGWETKYPAFKWCADLGDDWYLPAKDELRTICNNKDKLDTNLTDKLFSDYWSSTEDDEQYDGKFCAWGVTMYDGSTLNLPKFDLNAVRAVATFGNTQQPEPEPDFDSSSYIDLSAAGTANCYLVKAAGKYKFKVVKGNSTQSVGSASSATVLWESFGTSTTPNEGDLIASATYKDGYVYFATPTTFNSGNASIAVRDSNDTVLWSWHIWLSKEGWNDHVYANNAGTMMDRNLGATSATPGSVGALGLMYQWGRKDPFLGSSSVSSSTLAVSTGTWSSVTTQQTVDYVTANPMTFVRQNYEWCTGDGAEDSNYAKRWTESTKSMYDPCPVGYRVPDGGKNGFWATALGTSSSTTAGITWYSTYYGCLWTLSDGKLSAWYPIVGCRDTSGGALGNVGSIGYYWSASPHASDGERAYYLCFYDSKVSPMNYVNRCLGQSVRCVRE